MAEFLLKPSDLDDLRKTKRRSPFENEPRITVYWMKDVEKRYVTICVSLIPLEQCNKYVRTITEFAHIVNFNFNVPFILLLNLKGTGSMGIQRSS